LNREEIQCVALTVGKCRIRYSCSLLDQRGCYKKTATGDGPEPSQFDKYLN
jgi:hypothetical protein